MKRIITREAMAQAIQNNPHIIFAADHEKEIAIDGLIRYPTYVNWYSVCAYQRLDQKSIRALQDIYGFRWDILAHFQPLTEDCIKEFIYYFRKNVDKLQVSEEFIREFHDHLDWYDIAKSQKLSEEFMNEFTHRMAWGVLARHQVMSEDFIRTNAERLVVWPSLFVMQNISEEFIDEMLNKYPSLINNKDTMTAIVTHKVLSREFINKYCRGIVDKKVIRNYQKSTHSFWKRPWPHKNWMYKSVRSKRRIINNCGLYEIDGDNVIAYKGVGKGGYSKYSLHYKYEIGQTYHSNADFNVTVRNSFGLSAWTKEEASKYCDELMLKVSIPIRAIAALVKGEDKIRTTEFTVIGAFDQFTGELIT